MKYCGLFAASRQQIDPRRVKSLLFVDCWATLMVVDALLQCCTLHLEVQQIVFNTFARERAF